MTCTPVGLPSLCLHTRPTGAPPAGRPHMECPRGRLAVLLPQSGADDVGGGGFFFVVRGSRPPRGGGGPGAPRPFFFFKPAPALTDRLPRAFFRRRPPP